MPGLFGGGRRQFETHDVAAAGEAAAVEDQHAVAVVDARAGFGRRDQAAQHRRDAFRIDRKIETGQRIVGGTETFAGLQVEQPVRIDGDAVGFGGAGRGDGARDDFAGRQQVFGARIDQAGAELREIENARHQRDQAGQIQRNDAAGQAGEAEREEKLSGAAQPVHRTLPAVQARIFGGSGFRSERRGGVLGIQAWIRLRSIKQWPKLPVVSIVSCEARCLRIYPRQAAASVKQTAVKRRQIRFP